MDLTKYQGVIFDMDGTLVDSMPSHIEAWRLTCEYFGYPFDAQYMNELGGVPTLETVELLNQKHSLYLPPEQVVRKKEQLWRETAATPPLIAITAEILNRCAGCIPVGVGTGAERAHAIATLKQHGLLEKLGAVVTATDVSKGKPHPETFLRVAELLSVPPQHCVVFEDTEIGKRAALEASMDCILVKNGQLIL